MYFINYAKCSACRHKQKKSVASKKGERSKICRDCDKEFYDQVAENQKKYFLKGGK